VFDHVLYEIKGDAENLLGLKEEAKLSYLQAIALAQSQSIQALLRMKLADLEIKE
jgi:predicted negative regulator of RcsB-dependent stress response